jgi:hypothetical protein
MSRRTYVAEFMDYATEGIKFFFAIQSYAKELKEEFEFISVYYPYIMVAHPASFNKETARILTDAEVEADRIFDFYDEAGLWIWQISFVPTAYLTCEALKHKMTEKLLWDINGHIRENYVADATVLDREEGQTNKQWVRANVEAWSNAVLAVK